MLKIFGAPYRCCDGIRRRTFLQIGAAARIGIAGSVSFQRPGNRNRSGDDEKIVDRLLDARRDEPARHL